MNKMKKKKRFSDVIYINIWRLSLISEWTLKVTTYIEERDRVVFGIQERRRQCEHRSRE